MERRLPSGRSFFHKSDLIVVAVLVLAALAAWLGGLLASGSGQTVVRIYSDNELFFELSLPAKDQTIPVPDKQLVLEIKDNQVGVLTTDCPDQTCKKTGYISRPGQSIICLPNRVAVQLAGGGATVSGVDAIAE